MVALHSLKYLSIYYMHYALTGTWDGLFFSGEVGRMEAKDLLKVNSILLATYGCIIMTVQIEVDSIQSIWAGLEQAFIGQADKGQKWRIMPQFPSWTVMSFGYGENRNWCVGKWIQFRMKWVQFEPPVGGLSMWRNAKYGSEVDFYTRDNTADLEQ